MQNIRPFSSSYKQINSWTSLVLIVVCTYACQSKMQKKQWAMASLDPAIANNVIYTQLNKETEVFSMHEKRDTSKKRTSGVAYFTKGHVNLSDSNAARFNNCRAHFYHDMLLIDIGIGNGFGGYGFAIHYKDRKFYTEPYYTTDVVIPDKPEPNFEVAYQKLILNKAVFRSGDSLYGKIDFKMVEIEKNGDRITHHGNGYFRTIVKDLTQPLSQ